VSTLFSSTIIGYVGFVKKLNDGNGNEAYSISVGVDAGTKEAKKTEWVEVILQGALSGAGPYITPGRQVYAEGAHTNVQFLKKDKTPGFASKIKAHTFRFLDEPKS
jgi:hypothetical protein